MNAWPVLKPRLRARDDDDDERGSTTIEFVIGAALMVLMLLAIVQVALYFHLRAVATTAARQGLDRVRVVNGTPGEGVASANQFLDQAGSSLQGRSVTADRTGQQSSVSVSGGVVSVVPGLHLHVHVTVTAPTERVEP
jgi:Flp pilus assembly protein TadG